MTTPWDTVRIFISSTFEDMHAERDYLVKQVFPELREWCEQRKLNLVDIDLRWGVKEEDTQNNNVVEVCLNRIDDARPFFLCFLGQRRGWVPQARDISSSTLLVDAFPDLISSIGNSSVTEMEILHALIHPFHGSRLHKEQKPEYYEPVKYAFFYLRDPSYLEELPNDFPDTKKIYTNEGLSSQEERDLANQQLDKWRMEQVPALCQQRELPLRHYKANWNLTARSPELLLPLECSSTIPANQKQWQKRWIDAGVVANDSIVEDPIQIEKAKEYNQKRTSGRLTNFELNGNALKSIILQDLKNAIEERFPDHHKIGEATDLQKELDQQEQFLQVCREGFISRGDDFKELNQYIQDDRRHTFLLTAPGGVGKSTLLANWVDELRLQNENNAQNSIHFRFIGQSDHSSNVDSLLYFLLNEIKTTTHKLDEPLPESTIELRKELVGLLANIGKNGKTIIVIDALNQLENGISDLSWIPWQLPENIKLIISFKSGEENAEKLLDRLQGQISHSEVQPFTNLEDRRMLVKAYLSQYLKDLDEKQIETLIQSEGASNPLYLKVALSELRVFGAFSNLNEKIKHDFGDTPLSAFNGVLKRLEEDPAYSLINPTQAVPLIFSLLAYSRAGLSAGELSLLLTQSLGLDENENNLSNVGDTVFLFLRQVRPFLSHRDGRYDFFYESFKMAVRQRYNSMLSPQDCHLKLANYFEKLQTWKEKQNLIPTARKIAELPYHLAMSASSQAYQNYLTDFDFLQAKIIGMGVPALLEDFKLKNLPDLNLDFKILADLTLIERAIYLSQKNLKIDPQLFAGQLIARLGNINKGSLLGRLFNQLKTWTDQPWIRPLTSHYNQPKSELQFMYQASNFYIGEAFSTPDGQALIVLSQETKENQFTLKRIESFTGKVIHQVLLDKIDEAIHLSLSSDGKKAAIITSKMLFIYDAETLALQHTYPISGESIGENSTFLRLSPNGLFAFVIEKKWVSQINLQNGERVRQFEIKRGMSQFIFSPSGKLAAFCIGGGRWIGTEGNFSKEEYFECNNIDELYVLDMQNTTTPKLISNHAISDEFIFSADENHLICVNESGRVETWQISEAKSLGILQTLNDEQFKGVMQGLRSSGYHYRGDAKIVSSANGEKAICSFSSAYMATLNVSNPHHVTIEKHLYSVSYTQKLKLAYDNYAVCLSPTKELIIWNIDNGNLIKRLKDNAMIRDFWVAQLDDKTVIFSRNEHNAVQVWDISNLEEPNHDNEPLGQAEDKSIYSMKTHPMGKTICIVKMMSIKFFSVSGRSVMGEIRTAPPILMEIHYHPDGERIVLVYIDGTIKILSVHNLQTIKLIKLKSLDSSFVASSLSPDGEYFLYMNEDNKMMRFNLETEEELDFEETSSLDLIQRSQPSDSRITMDNSASGQENNLGKSQIVVLPESHEVISFHKPKNTFSGRLDDANGWMEIHDLKTRKLVNRQSRSGYYPIVIKTQISKNGRSFYQLNGRKELDAYPPIFSYAIEKTSSELITKQIITSRDISDFSVSSDDSYATLVKSDGSLDFVSIETGETICHFRGDYIFTCCTTLDDGTTLCAGDENGDVNFFRVENVLKKSNSEMGEASEIRTQFANIPQNTVQIISTQTAEMNVEQPKKVFEEEKSRGNFLDGLFKKTGNLIAKTDIKQKENMDRPPEILVNNNRIKSELSIELGSGVRMEFVCIPAGEFLMGRDKKNDPDASNEETPEHKVNLNEYMMGLYPVTNEQYQIFVNAVGYKKPEHWQNGVIPQGKENHPVVCVSWEDAVTFCTWASKVSGQVVRLPNEAEWEKAARGTDRRTYPWGNNIDKSFANYDGSGTTSVDCYKKGESPYGVFDMVGNVLEWVDDWYEGYPGNAISNPEFGTIYRVQRGGSFDLKYVSNLRVSHRARYFQDSSDNTGGFRCVC